ncbi:MAG: cbb3-type cytochrome c oxidase subunit I [Chloroflexi bacterium]|nr:cbb3-type cytochrome c oxidase subunit I [Chloroflexota bacterium]
MPDLTPKYQSQRVSYWFFLVASLLFVLQVVDGIIIAAQYIWPQLLMYLYPFNVGGEVHLNLLVFWLVLGFMGIVYYLVPEETGQEIWSTRLAYIQLGLLVLTGVAVLVGFIVPRYGLTWTEGREYIEAPRWADWLIAIGAVLFVVNVGLTVLRRIKPITATLGVLLTGIIGLAVVYLFGMRFFSNLTVDQFFWWWVVHLWVEGTWELIAAGVMAFILMRLTGVDRAVVEKWLYVEVALVLFTGILGTGHHYYWIGTPAYWLWVGGFFSAMEPVPIVLMVYDTLRYVRERRTEITNQVALHWTVGGVITHFFGAGVWGFSITLPQVNYWTHGTQLTPSHGHLAFFGAYATLVLMSIYTFLPEMRGLQRFGQRRGLTAFWVINVGMVGMVLMMAAAGIVQVYLERMLGIDHTTVVNQYLNFWLFWRLVFGVVMVAGVLIYLWDFFALALGTRAPVARPTEQRPAVA